MRTEEILRHQAEYRAIREALGEYDVTLVLAHACSQALPEAGKATEEQDHVGLETCGPDALPVWLKDDPRAIRHLLHKTRLLGGRRRQML